jgi:hypothetical protein
MCDRCLMAASDHWRARLRPDGHRVPRPHDPAALTACTIAVWSASGRLARLRRRRAVRPFLFTALPLETARHWVAQGKASVETPHAICCDSKEYDHAC